MIIHERNVNINYYNFLCQQKASTFARHVELFFCLQLTLSSLLVWFNCLSVCFSLFTSFSYLYSESHCLSPGMHRFDLLSSVTWDGLKWNFCQNPTKAFLWMNEWMNIWVRPSCKSIITTKETLLNWPYFRFQIKLIVNGSAWGNFYASIKNHYF